MPSPFPVVVESYPQPGGRIGTNTAYGGQVTDVDNPNDHPEDGMSLPWCIDPGSTWLDYRCAVEIQLDPGSVLHKPLPQDNPKWDTLGSIDITDQAFTSGVAGVNLNSNSSAVDIIQRMASSTYRFVLRGWGVRVGYQIPIPNLLKVGNSDAVPTDPQFASQEVVGNMLGGIPLFYATWELHYIVAQSPRITQLAKQPIAPNNAAHIRPDAELPSAVRVPTMPTDSRAVQTAPPRLGQLGVFVGPQ